MDFDLGIDNAQFDAGIRQASEFEQSKRLAEDIRLSLQTLKSLDFSLRLLNSSLAELRQDAGCLSADFNDKLHQLQNALTIVIPPQTTEHLEQIFQASCNIFDRTLQEKMDATIQKAEQSFNAAEQRMKQQTDRIVKHSMRIALPPTLCYICLSLLLCLAVFFGIVWWANANVIHFAQIETLCHVFAVLPLATTVCIFVIRCR